MAFRSVCTTFDLLSKVLPFGNAQKHLAFRSLIRIFVPMKKLTYLIIYIVVLMACTSQGRYTAMRKGLDSINMLNKSYQPFTVADIQPYVQYFDDYGTSNDRVLAYYLMGRAYHDQREAPMALEYYQKAIEQADTTEKDFDFAQLSKVYGQMADLFYYQNLYDEQLVSLEKAIFNAWKSKDTLAAIMDEEQKVKAFWKMKEYGYVLYTVNSVYDKYRRYCYPIQAAISLSASFPTLIELDSLDALHHAMLVYEKESNLFDENGNIEKGREVYYYYKGLLCLKEQRLDSADYWFRKELRDGKDWNNQNAASYGLAMLYEQRHMPDSAAKYYKYSYAMNDSVNEHKAITEVERMQALYDYTRNQEIAMQESDRAERFANFLRLGTALFIALCLIVYIIINRYRQHIKEKHQQYMQSLMQIEQAQSDIIRLRNEGSGLETTISQKEEIITRLQAELVTYHQQVNKNSREIQETKLKKSEIYQTFIKLSVKGKQPTENEWRALRVVLFDLFPQFHQLLISESHSLNVNEFNACILIRAHFKPGDICNMLDVSSSYANKLRRTLLKKLFNTEGKADEFDERIISVC